MQNLKLSSATWNPCNLEGEPFGYPIQKIDWYDDIVKDSIINLSGFD